MARARSRQYRGRRRRALADALFVAMVTLVATLADPLHHRSAWMLAVLIGLGAAGGGLMATVARPDVLAGVVLGVLAGILVWLALVFLAAIVVEWPAFLRADMVFRHHDAGGRAVARVSASTAGSPAAQEHGGSPVWRVSSVAAWPRGGGRGSVLMREVIRVANKRGVTLELMPSTPRIGKWYERLGFTSAERGKRLRRAPVA